MARRLEKSRVLLGGARGSCKPGGVMLRAAVWTAATFAAAAAALVGLGPAAKGVEPALLFGCGAVLVAGVPLLYRDARARRPHPSTEPHLPPAPTLSPVRAAH